MSSDFVYLNGPVFTGAAAPRFARAVAVTGERIVAVGQEPDVTGLIGPGTEVIDLAGRLLSAGFQDAHVHPGSSGLDLLRCSFDGCNDAESAVAFVVSYAESRPDEPWILGGGWSQDWFPRGCPPKEMLDSIVADRPILLYNRDGHGAWANSLALKRAGVDEATEDPVDGRIERNVDGSPQGTLHEGATRLVQRIAPADSFDDIRAGMLRGQDYLLSLGITGWQDAHVDEPTHQVYRSLAEGGKLVGHAVGALWWDRHRGMDQIEELEQMRAEPMGRYEPGPVKLMLDGVVESKTASMIEPYLENRDQTENRGIDFIHPHQLQEIVTELDRRGFSCHFHAIGDAAVRNAIDAVEAARIANGWLAGRHHIAHLQVIHPDDIPRFRRLGVTANIQALWACDGGYQTELTKPVLGPQRTNWQYPFGSLFRSGATLAMGSDWGVSTANVMEQVAVAVSRTSVDEPDLPPLNTGERLDLGTALTAFTAGSAYVNHRDGESGMVVPGMLADLVVLDGDPFDGQVAGIGVTMTMVSGEVVYRSGM
jgi:hypothetical protein